MGDGAISRGTLDRLAVIRAGIVAGGVNVTVASQAGGLTTRPVRTTRIPGFALATTARRALVRTTSDTSVADASVPLAANAPVALGELFVGVAPIIRIEEAAYRQGREHRCARHRRQQGEETFESEGAIHDGAPMASNLSHQLCRQHRRLSPKSPANAIATRSVGGHFHSLSTPDRPGYAEARWAGQSQGSEMDARVRYDGGRRARADRTRPAPTAARTGTHPSPPNAGRRPWRPSEGSPARTV